MKLIFLFGPAASGKLTIARELSALTGFALFHNHLVVDAVSAVFPFGSRPFVRLREAFWLQTFEEAAQAGRDLIFTFAPEGSVAPDFPRRVEQRVRASGGDITFVRLLLSPEAQERRIANPDRAAFGKLISVSLLRELRSDFAAAETAMPAAVLTIDTETTDAASAAKFIAERLRLAPDG